MQLHFDTTDDDILLVRFLGEELGADVADQVRSALIQHLSAHSWAAMDLSPVTFIDSSGLGVLVAALKQVRDRGEVRLFSVHPRVADLFRLTGLTRFLLTEPDEESALASLRERLNARRAA